MEDFTSRHAIYCIIMHTKIKQFFEIHKKNDSTASKSITNACFTPHKLYGFYKYLFTPKDILMKDVSLLLT